MFNNSAAAITSCHSFIQNLLIILFNWFYGCSGTNFGECIIQNDSWKTFSWRSILNQGLAIILLVVFVKWHWFVHALLSKGSDVQLCTRGLFPEDERRFLKLFILLLFHWNRKAPRVMTREGHVILPNWWLAANAK